MDPRLLDAYNRELTYLREMGREFAQEYPKVAAKLSLDNVDLPDPHVERLIESFAFLSARITLKQEEEFPKFTQQRLSTSRRHCFTARLGLNNDLSKRDENAL